MDLYKINEVRAIQHYQVPKVLLKHPYYDELSNDTRLAYSILLDRLELSRVNNWTNEKDEVFIFYTRDEMAKELKIKSKTTITKVFKQLNDFNLIHEERQGLNKPNRIYVAHLQPLPIETERGKNEPTDLGIYGGLENGLPEVHYSDNGSTEIEPQEVQNLNSNNTNFNNFKIDRFNLLFNKKGNGENLAGTFDRKDDTKGISIAEYLLTNPTDRRPSDIGLTPEEEKDFIKALETAELYIQPEYYDFFYAENNEKFRQLSYLMYGVVYDMLKTPHKRLLSRLNRDLIIDVLNRVDMYQEEKEIDDIYAYFKASLIRELQK